GARACGARGRTAARTARDVARAGRGARLSDILRNFGGPCVDTRARDKSPDFALVDTRLSTLRINGCQIVNFPSRPFETAT
uniref:hypothetical protein n=1 Tax=Variovorax sp. dw_954 TaxID=2720078 RepID=UPI001BD3E790